MDTYDIPPPSVELVDPLPNLPSSPAPENKESHARDSTKTPPVGYRRLSGNKPSGAAVTPNNTPKSASPTPKSPDWYEELDDGQISMFKEVSFHLSNYTCLVPYWLQYTIFPIYFLFVYFLCFDRKRFDLLCIIVVIVCVFVSISTILGISKKGDTLL